MVVNILNPTKVNLLTVAFVFTRLYIKHWIMALNKNKSNKGIRCNEMKHAVAWISRVYICIYSVITLILNVIRKPQENQITQLKSKQALVSFVRKNLWAFSFQRLRSSAHNRKRKYINCPITASGVVPLKMQSFFWNSALSGVVGKQMWHLDSSLVCPQINQVLTVS